MPSRTETVPTSFDEQGIPEVEHVDFDLWELRIIARFGSAQTPVYVVFSGPVGFRVLDEGNLLDFWSSETRAHGWIWRILDGGWIDQERQRPGFVGAGPAIEYLVLGTDMCVSVMCNAPPIVRSPE